MRTALDVRVPAGQWGGIQQMVEGLARGLSDLDGDDEFLFIGFEDAAMWLDPLLGGSCRRVEVGRAHGSSWRRRAYDSVTSRLPGARHLAAVAGQRMGRLSTPIPGSDGFLESLGVDAVHFVTPQAYRTQVPSVYQVMDLLQDHLPYFFSPFHRRYRQVTYRAFSDQAALISTMTNWTRSDIAERLEQPASKIAVVPLPPAVTPETTLPKAPTGLENLADRFLLYPAQTWPHKNHLALVDAMGFLRDQGSDVDLVCTGRLTEHHPVIARRVEQLGLGPHVRFLGYVEQSELAWLYRNASALVFPSLFEGWGIPIVEAMAWSLPVACSDIPVLDEVAGSAALRFEPRDSTTIAAAIGRITADAALRRTLIAAGRARLEPLTWDRIARTFRALYRRAAGQRPTLEDAAYLMPPTLQL
ncbi:MAG TPA: glycosyltransferase family 1 protein [Thermomicrobiales bacterium]|nr:glycosyltransferase family 1 protein [Thermomicrobiales bacterium]